MTHFYPSAGISSGESSRTLTKLGIEEIHRNPRQPRQYFDKEKLHELAESIKANGILQPIVVRKSKDGFEIVAGERRWRAAQEAGQKQVPCIIQAVGDQEILELALIENIQRDDLSPIEEASAYKMMVDDVFPDPGGNCQKSWEKQGGPLPTSSGCCSFL